MAKEFPAQPYTPWTLYRWSALALLTPYLENTAAYDSLNLSVPLYGPSFGLMPQNRETIKIVVAEFLCPSDIGRPVSEEFAPTNYAMCAGSGIDGGSPIATDGICFTNSETTPAKITDGLSKSALISESLLGEPQATDPHQPQFEYKFRLVAPLTDSLCAQANQWNYTDPRGFAWVNGEFRCALYNHYMTPNSATFDCMGVLGSGDIQVRLAPYGWRAARSNHPGGVNVAMADGSGRFFGNEVDATVWKMLSTIAGAETGETP